MTDVAPVKRTYAKRNRKALTEQNVRTLKPKRLKQYLIWDEGTGAARGLAILVSPTGTKSYRCAYYYPGSPKAHWMHLGRVVEMSLAQARELCNDARGKARRGEDPKSDAPGNSDSFSAAVESYIKHEQIGRHGNKSAEQTKAVMLRNCAEWHSHPITTIRYPEIEKLLWLVRDGDSENGLKPRPYLANRLYSHLKAFFAWCARRGVVKVSPMHDMERPWDKGKRRERDWFKKGEGDNAIRALYRSADEIGGNDGRFIKLMLLTGKRKTALANMLWEEIDEAWFWDPPPSNVKNKRLHGVPLPKLAQRVLHPRQDNGKVFGDINLDKLERKIKKASGMEDFFWHGLRHLAETKTAELRDERDHPLIPPHVRDMLFDHSSKRGSGKGYDHHDYKPEMRAAMQVWADYVEQLVQTEGTALLR
jgi:integrase